MDYKLIVTERADELIDRTTAYLIEQIKDPDAASHFLDELEEVYDRLENDPFQFSESKDRYLYLRGYREALLQKMKYRVVLRTEEQTVYILGVFHTLEDYGTKLGY